MSQQPERPSLSRSPPGTAPALTFLTAGCAAVTLVLAFLTLAGWAADGDVLRGGAVGLPAMKINTALALIALAVAVLLLRAPASAKAQQRTARALGAAVAVFGLVAGGEYLFGGIGIDTLFAADASTRFPGRPAHQTVLALVVLGGAVATFTLRPRLSSALVTVAWVMVLFTVVGYIDGVDFLRARTGRSGVAANTVVSLTALVVALTALDPRRGIASQLRGADAGARMARIVLPISVGTALVFGGLGPWLERHANLDSALSDALYTLAMVLTLMAVVLLTARSLRRYDARVERLAQIVETAHEGIITNRPDGTITSWNAAAERIFGYSAQEMIGRPIDVLAGSATREPVASEGTLVFETQRVASDGRVIDVALSVTPMHTADGEIFESTIVRDITVERRREAERQRLAAVVAFSADAVVSLDSAGCFTSWNSGAQRLLGFTEEEILGRHVSAVVPDELRPEFAGAMVELDAGRSVTGWETKRRHKDGRLLEVEITASPLSDEQGARTGITAIMRDTGERREASRRFELLLEAAPDGMIIVDDQGRIVQVNAQVEQVFGYRREELVGERVELLVPSVTRGHHVALRESYTDDPHPRVMRGGVPLSGRAKDGSGIPVEISLSPLMTPDGPLVIAAVRDVRQRRDAERALEASEELFRRSFEDSGIGMALVGLSGTGLGEVLQVNDALATITGRAAEELRGTKPLAVLHPEDVEEVADEFMQLLSGELTVLRREVRMIHAEGDVLWAAVTVSLVRDSDGEPLHAVVQVQDVGDRKRFEGQLQHLADHDALTGLFNRRRFEEELLREVASAQRYGTDGSVLVLDLDHFKVVNDTFGHAAGDQLIVITAELLRRRLRESDVLSRMGGDEFAIILPHADVEQSRQIGESLLNEIREDTRASSASGVHRVTASIGIAPFGPGRPADGPEELLAQADIAMYDAKEDGRDRVAVYDAGQARHARMQARVTWTSRIEVALAQGGFVLHAQPIVPVAGVDGTRRHELLVRMVGPDGELIMPGTFLYVAERSDLAQRIDRWVVEQAVALLAEERRLGHDVAFSVNLSGRSVNDAQTLDHIVETIDAAGVDPARLTFEVTETAAIVNISRATEFAARLRRIGCTLALDDFGAGFASFYYLKHLSFDFLKIDGEFIKDLPSSRTNQLVVRSLVDIARGMGKQTVAEFVGDEATMDLLREYGVDYAQGYHLGRPEPLDVALDREGLAVDEQSA